jgi:hypothetical protein
MSDMELKKEQEIERMVKMVKQLDLPGIQLLTRDADTLLALKRELDRQKDSLKDSNNNERMLA